MANNMNKAVVDIQKRNPFDLSFINSLTGKVGTLVPCLCRKVVPGDILSDSVNFKVELPPLAASFRGKIDFRMEAFYVPNRLLYGGWQDYMMFNGGLADQYRPEGVDKCYLPKLRLRAGALAFANGSLADYLGIPSFKGNELFISALPFLAYHKIYDDWYRDPAIQKPVFRPKASNDTSFHCYDLPYTRLMQDTALNSDDEHPNTTFFDGSDLSDLRQRNYGKDYFTSAYTTINGGSSPVSVVVSQGGAGVDTTFTISQFRAANALQRFAERNQLARGDYKKSIFVNYGVTPADSICNRSIYLGSLKSPIVNNSVYAQSASTNDSQNPFTEQVAGRASNAYASADGTLFKNFKVTEHGYIMVLCSLVPQAAYGNGLNRELLELGKFSDAFVVPSFAQVGNQDIKTIEASADATVTSSLIFGYTERYANYKTSQNEVHGKLRDGQNLSFMMVKRDIGGVPTISTNFIQIKTTDLDNITAVKAWLSNYGYIADIFHNFKALRPLPRYSIPTLCDHILDSKWVDIDKSYNL